MQKSMKFVCMLDASMRFWPQANRSLEVDMTAITSLVSLDSSGFTCAPAPARATCRPAPIASFSEAADYTVREAVGVFHSADDLQKAIDDLLRSGFHRSALSL